ncbi:MAG: hypothetical protein U5K72_16780 [Balneolaceae bacterium]|nr:hypothetical protein [Balneolaceae bacterium]
MKSYLKIISVPLFFVGIVMLILSSCENGDSPLSPDVDKTDVRDAYLFLVEAHAVKQDGMFTIIKAFSNDYKSKFLEEEMTEEQLMKVAETLDSFSAFAAEHRDELNDAGNIFEYYTPKKDLKGAMVDFFGWISGSSKRARTRVLTVASNLTKEERSQLYNDWLREETKQESENEDDFWKKLEKGELDTKANSIFADFNNNLEFIEMAQEKDLDIHKIFVKEGAEGINKGATVLIEAVKEATPLGEGMGMVENANNYIDNAEKAVDAPLDGDGKLEQVENAIKDYLSGYVPIDEIIDNSEMAKDLSESLKNLYNTSKGARNPENWLNRNPKWGGVKIVDKSKTGSECDIVVAEATDSNFDNITQVLIGLTDYVSNTTEFEMVVPEGNWEFKSVDIWGNFEKQVTDIIAGAMNELSVFSEPDENGDDDGDDELSKDLTGRWDGTLVIEEINFDSEDIEEDEDLAEGCEIDDFEEIDFDQFIGVEQPFVLQLEIIENSQEYEATMIIYDVEDELTSGFSDNSSMKTAYNIYTAEDEDEEVIYLHGVFTDNSLTLTGKEQGVGITYVGEFEIKGEDKYTLSGYWLMGTTSKPEMMTGSWSSERLPPEFWK